MKFTVGVNVGGPHYDPARMGAIARQADALGFHSVGAAERLIMPRVIKSQYPRGSGAIPGVGSAQNTLEVLSVISFLAGQTSRIRLMPFVVMPYRNPLLAAKMLATIDVLSNGRLDILLGVGWNREEARALMVPTPFDKRGAVTNEYLRAFVTLWNEEYPEFQGKYLRFSDVEFAPQPVQRPHPPFWIGGESPAAIRRAATLGDGWSPGAGNPQFPLDTPDQFQRAVDSLHRRAAAAGRDPGAIAIRFGTVTWTGGQAGDRSRRSSERTFYGQRRADRRRRGGADQAGRHPYEPQHAGREPRPRAGAAGELRRASIPTRRRLGPASRLP